MFHFSDESDLSFCDCELCGQSVRCENNDLQRCDKCLTSRQHLAWQQEQRDKEDALCDLQLLLTQVAAEIPERRTDIAATLRRVRRAFPEVA